jgi:hypothetical protein
MADDAGMHIKRDHPQTDVTIADIARQELALTAMAFFAPVVGAVYVMRGLFRDSERETKAPPPERERDAA